ncbi:MAG: amidohydrolase family protein [Planctomycetes bacterium]|nr:amidohydrolase family protein [Planctomycetota bacterium]
MTELAGRPLVGRLWTGRLLTGGRLVPGALRIADGKIESLELRDARAGDAELPIIAPGLVDLHIHGYGGCDPVGELHGMARALALAGTTAFQPTLFPCGPTVLGGVCERAWRAAQALRGPVARAVGLHLEGPFVNPERAGALPRHDLAEPSLAGLRAILGPATGDGRGVRTVTLAPELRGSSELVAELVRCGVRVSLGHSKATAEDSRAAARAGASGATHLFNAMNAIHHREVGLAGFALLERALYAELIGDLVHVGGEAIEIALAARGPTGLALVSDALRGAGTGCDVFHSHGREHLIDDGTAYYPPGPDRAERALAGTAMGQLDMVRRLVKRGVVGLEDALAMASETPARALGLEREIGVLAPGARADLIVLRGPELALEDVLVGGESVPRG